MHFKQAVGGVANAQTLPNTKKWSLGNNDYGNEIEENLRY
jgi:hypothetical protein